MNLPTITESGNCLYLTMDLNGLNPYDRAKAIINFCDKETKLFEREIDRAVLEIFKKNGINIPSTDKKVLKLAFDLLKMKGKAISIVDIYKDKEYDYCKKVKETKNKFTVVIEDEYHLQCGVEVKEILK